MESRVRLAALALALTLTPGCGDSGTEDDTEPAWTEMDATQRYAPDNPEGYRCTGCHLVAE